jgi:hypothetical protein
MLLLRRLQHFTKFASLLAIMCLRHQLISKTVGNLDCLAEGRLIVQPTVSWHKDNTTRWASFCQARRIAGRTSGCLAGVVRDGLLRLRQTLSFSRCLSRTQAVADGRARFGLAGGTACLLLRRLVQRMVEAFIRWGPCRTN